MIFEGIHLLSRKNLFSVSGAVTVSVITEGYGIVRSIQTLVDRRKHQQNIGLRSSESRSCWLAIVGNLIGFASAGATVAAGSGAAMGLVGARAVKSVRTGSGVVSVARVANWLNNKIRKLRTKRKFARYLTDNCENREVFKIFRGNEKYGLTLISFETTNPPVQEAAQISLM
jgi:hypothetical protein